MTFRQARDILRSDVLAETSTDYYTDDDLFGYVRAAAKQLALMFGFPTSLGMASIAAGDAAFPLPADAETLDLDEVAFDGWVLQLAPYRQVLSLVDDAMLGVPRFYNYEPKRGGLALIAPRAHKAGDVLFEYVRRYDVSGVTLDSPIWEDLFPSFHELVVYRAGVRAFEASLEQDRAAYWGQKEQAMMQEFSAYLNKTPFNRLVGQEVAES